MTESERIALCAVLGITDIIRGDFEEMLNGKTSLVKRHAYFIKNEIDELVEAETTVYNEEHERAEKLETEILDLKYQIKELIYRIEERRDIRNDLHYKDLRRVVGL